MFAYWTRVGEKYFGDHPERIDVNLRHCRQIEMASSCHGNDGWARMIGMSGKSTATSSIGIGFPYFRRMPPPPGMPGSDAAVAGVEENGQPRFRKDLVQRIGHAIVWRELLDRRVQLQTTNAATSHEAPRFGDCLGPSVRIDACERKRDVGIFRREVDHGVVADLRTAGQLLVDGKHHTPDLPRAIVVRKRRSNRARLRLRSTSVRARRLQSSLRYVRE